MGKQLTPRQAKFVAAYLAGKTGHEAARAAGYPEGSVKSRSQFMLRKCAATVAAIAEGQKALRIAANFDQEAAFKKFDKAIEFAMATKNASAYVKAVESQARLTGLIDKGQGKVHLEINLSDLRTQIAAGYSRIDEFRRLGKVAGAEMIDRIRETQP